MPDTGTVDANADVDVRRDAEADAQVETDASGRDTSSADTTRADATRADTTLSERETPDPEYTAPPDKPLGKATRAAPRLGAG
jgi:hypothetical protein